MEISYLDKQEGYENSAPQRTGKQGRGWRGRRPSGAVQGTISEQLDRVHSLSWAQSSQCLELMVFLPRNLFLQELAKKMTEIKEKSNMYKIDMGIPPK
ncbi:unnamed protein product [Microthlaspi erraticum]|uniref:Uncharacterized protein n=1 Tax=Microthlaspi erraticum TaxID=1685480 RepID=A0A6D2I3I2_9BRAS|nr:unnamed protein product [Microthlaspi erraticum]